MKDKLKNHFRGNYKSFFEKYLSDVQKIGSKANEFKAICPFHKDTDPSFNFNNENSKYFCHGCGKKGNYIHFYAKLKGLRTKEDFIKILKYSERFLLILKYSERFLNIKNLAFNKTDLKNNYMNLCQRFICN